MAAKATGLRGTAPRPWFGLCRSVRVLSCSVCLRVLCALRVIHRSLLLSFDVPPSFSVSFQDGKGDLDRQLDESSMSLFAGGQGTVKGKQVADFRMQEDEEEDDEDEEEEDEEEEEDDEEEDGMEEDEEDDEDDEDEEEEDEEEEEEEDDDEEEDEEEEDDDEEEEEEEEEGGAQWKADMAAKAEQGLADRRMQSTRGRGLNLMHLIYGREQDDDGDAQDRGRWEVEGLCE